MNLSDKDMLELLELMALNADTAKIAEHYLEGLGKDASVKERTSKFIELLIRDGSAMGFEPDDDIGDIVWCLDDIADHYHLLLSSSWFSESDGMIGEAGIGICMVSELAGEDEDDEDEENEAIDWSLG